MTNKFPLWLILLMSLLTTFLGCFIMKPFLVPHVAVLSGASVDESSLSSLESTLLATLSTVSSAVVSISVYSDVKDYLADPTQIVAPLSGAKTSVLAKGSGILVNKNGYIITNKHVVQDSGVQYMVTFSDGHMIPVQHIWFDDTLDLAILSLDMTKDAGYSLTPANFLPFAVSARIGQFVLTIGNTLGEYPNSVSFGILSAKNRSITVNSSNLYAGLYQTDALVGPGNSGGPLLDIQGRVMGVVTAKGEGQSLTFALPVSQEFVDTTLASIQKYSKIVRPLLGIQYVDITPSVQQDKKLSVSAGIYIQDVLAGMPAATAGLQAGDIVVAIQGKSISTQVPFLYHMYTYLPETTVTFTVLRGNRSLDIPVLLGQNGA